MFKAIEESNMSNRNSARKSDDFVHYNNTQSSVAKEIEEMYKEIED